MKPTKRAQLAIFLTVFVDLLGFGIVIPHLPNYAAAMAQSPAPWMQSVNHFFNLQDPGAFWAQMTMVSFSFAQFFAGPVLGRISDLAGRRPVLLASLLGTCLSYVVLATTGRIEWVLASRLFGGMAGANISVAQAAMADSSTREERSKVLGMIGAAFGMGFVLGPALGGILSETQAAVHLRLAHHWNLAFLVAAGLSLLAASMVVLWVPETLPPEARSRAKQVQSRGHALARALKRRGMPQILFIALLAMTGFALLESSFSLMIKERFHFGQREVGYVFGVLGILVALYQGGLVRMVVRFLPERIAQAAGLLLLACALPVLAYAPWRLPFLLVLIPVAWGQGMNNTATSALASQITPADEQGGQFGALQAMQSVGRILGPLVGGFVFGRMGFTAPFWVAAGCVTAALVLAVTLIRTPDPAPEGDPV
jgi:MFS transporter, DHA1 family, tetracycline resistance protein